MREAAATDFSESHNHRTNDSASAALLTNDIGAEIKINSAEEYIILDPTSSSRGSGSSSNSIIIGQYRWNRVARRYGYIAI